MPDESTLNVTPEAVSFVTDLLDQESDGDELALFIEVTGIRGSNFAYELSFVPLADADVHDLLERHDGLAVLMRGEDLEKLRGATLGMSTDEAASGLTIDNPNHPGSPTMGTAPRGDLTGSLAEQVQIVIEQQVNPAIAAHGGGAELVSVDEGTAYLRLMGGCQGCGMAQVTLRQGIERILLDSIPDLVEVVDVTDHASGDNPYYEAAKK